MSAPLSDAELDELERLASAVANPQHWSAETAADVAFNIAARAALPALIAEVRRVRKTAPRVSRPTLPLRGKP